MKRVLIDMDGVLANIAKIHQEKTKENPDMKYPQSQYGFFMEMEEIPDAIAAVKSLAEHFDVWFLSAPSWKNPLSLAEKNYWIAKHFGTEWAEKLILASDKSFVIGDYLIDDNKEGRGQDRFTGELIHFVNTTWIDVYNYLMKKEFGA